MWERSFQAAGVDEICQRANVKKGSFYYFFPSKTDLAIAAIENSWAQTKGGLFDPSTIHPNGGLNQFHELIGHSYEFQLELISTKGGVLGCLFGNLGQEMARQDERLRIVVQKIFDAHCACIETALVCAEKKGEIPIGDNRQRAKNIFALIEGAHLLAKVENDPQIFRSLISAILVLASG